VLAISVAAAAATFVTISNPNDEMFALTFGDDVRSALPAEDSVHTVMVRRCAARSSM
jgi:hypothetical protein